MTSNRFVVNDGKCHNFVKFRLDEFGNLPAIKDFEQILTVCAGRRIILKHIYNHMLKYLRNMER